MNLPGALILVVLLFVVVTARRRWALIGVMAGVLYLTQGQELIILGFHLSAFRFIELAGFIRVMARREFSFSKLIGLDKILLLLYIYTTVVFFLRSNEGEAYQIGVAVDAFLCYFTFRGLVGGVGDFMWFLRVFLILLVPYVVLVLVESLTRSNPFAFMGGIEYADWMREGRLRCQGSFRQPSLLGTLGAVFLPLYIGLAFDRAFRKCAVLGIGLCLLIVWASNSGGPLSCVGVGVVGWLFWRLRAKMRLVRYALAIGLFGLALVMKAPIWYLPARVSSITGGDGWHRSHLMDMAFQSLDRWWVAGMPIEDTRNWFPYLLPTTGAADITNQFVVFALAGGLGAMALFIALLVQAFRGVSRSLTAARARCHDSSAQEQLLWGVGVMLSVHIFNWLGISYFDQTYAIWFMQLAVISNLSETHILPNPIETLSMTYASTEAVKDEHVVASAQATAVKSYHQTQLHGSI